MSYCWLWQRLGILLRLPTFPCSKLWGLADHEADQIGPTRMKFKDLKWEWSWNVSICCDVVGGGRRRALTDGWLAVGRLGRCHQSTFLQHLPALCHNQAGTRRPCVLTYLMGCLHLLELCTVCLFVLAIVGVHLVSILPRAASGRPTVRHSRFHLA